MVSMKFVCLQADDAGRTVCTAYHWKLGELFMYVEAKAASIPRKEKMLSKPTALSHGVHEAKNKKKASCCCVCSATFTSKRALGGHMSGPCSDLVAISKTVFINR